MPWSRLTDLLRCPECGGIVTERIDEDIWEAVYSCERFDCGWYKVVDLNEGIEDISCMM